MPFDVETGHKTLCRIHEALGLPDTFPIVSFKMEADCKGAATAQVTFRVSKDQAEKLGHLLGKYRLEPIDSDFVDEAGFLHKVR